MDNFLSIVYLVGRAQWGEHMSMEETTQDGAERVLTNRQKTFSRFIVEGIYSNAEAARKAGFAETTAAKHASLLERRYAVTTIGQLERLHKLSLGAEENGQFSAAINAEKIRSALGGLTVDRREQVNSIDQLSRDEIVGRLADLQKKYPQAFEIEGTAKDITPHEQGTRGQLLEHIEIESTSEMPSDKD